MTQRPDAVTFDPSGILLTIAVSLYYFALQPWAILARTIILILTFTFSKVVHARQLKRSSAMAAPLGLVEQLELKTKRSVIIETALNDQTLARCHPQSQSPLFFKLPKELRDYILELSCTQSQDEQRSYSPNNYWYGPGHTSRLKTHTSLLQTCRQIWLESNGLPMRQAEHAFWFQRGPHDRHRDHGWRANIVNERDRYKRLFSSLTKRNLANVAHIRVFMQMFQAQQLTLNARMVDFFPRSLVQKGFKPRRFTLAIRSTDWWNWEDGQNLSLPSNLLQTLLDSPFLGGIDEFALELEAEERKADQLEPIIASAMELEGKPKLVDPTGQDQSTVCKFILQGPPRSMRWTRSPRINDTDHIAYKGMAELQLRVMTVVWRNKNCDMPDSVPQAAYPSSDGLTAAPAGGPGFTVHGRAPMLMFRPRALRERLRSGGWINGRFPEKEDEMRIGSVRKATQWEQVERERYEKMFGDIEARRLLAEWEKKESLLKFVNQA